MIAEGLVIKSERLLIRPLQIKDASELSKATFETWKDLNRWMQWAKIKSEMTDLNNCINYLANCARKMETGEDFTFGCFLKDCGDFVASIRLATFQSSKTEFEFCGIWCRNQFQRKGYASEALRCIINYAFSKLQAKRLIISHAEGNTPSKRLIQGLQFIFIGKRSNHIILNEANFDAYFYEIRAEDYYR